MNFWLKKNENLKWNDGRSGGSEKSRENSDKKRIIAVEGSNHH